jgi:L-ectoine synthase
VYGIVPDTCYILDQHDDHLFEALEDTVLISVFNPPIIGGEVHREDGSYAPPALMRKLEEVKRERL